MLSTPSGTTPASQTPFIQTTSLDTRTVTLPHHHAHTRLLRPLCYGHKANISTSQDVKANKFQMAIQTWIRFGSDCIFLQANVDGSFFFSQHNENG